MAFLLDFLPLIAFFGVFKIYGILPATATLVITTLLCALWHYRHTGKLPTSQLITAAVVALFGGLTLLFHDERFIKMKPTIIQLLFAAILIAGHKLGKNPLRSVLGKTLEITDRGWFILTRNFSCYFIVMAIANEIIWRHVSTETWVNFKVFGMMGISVLFIFWQMVWIQKFTKETES
jgi:intracellular septation protein